MRDCSSYPNNRRSANRAAGIAGRGFYTTTIKLGTTTSETTAPQRLTLKIKNTIH